MKPGPRALVLTLSLGAGLALSIAFRVQGDRARARQRHDLWLAYVRGPLALYVQGSREGSLALDARPGPAQRRGVADALQDLHQAWTQAGDLKPGFESDASLEPLDASMQWFTGAEQLAEVWPRLEQRRPDQLAAAQDTAEAMRRQLSLLAAQTWDQLSQDQALAWTPLERTESQDALQALAQSLPRKKNEKRRRHRLRKRKA